MPRGSEPVSERRALAVEGAGGRGALQPLDDSAQGHPHNRCTALGRCQAA